MATKFDQLDTDLGQKKFNGFLTSRSYLEGYNVSEADFVTFRSMGLNAVPVASKVPHLFRWYCHVASLLGVRSMISVCSKTTTATATAATAKKTSVSPKKQAKQQKKQVVEEEEEDDMFGDDDDEDDEEAAEAAKKRSDAAKAKKVKKVVIERSQVVLEVKPWDTETDLEALATKIKASVVPGLKWGEGHKLVPVAFGIKKLLVQCIIIDSEVLLDDITDKIESFEDYVQSVDVASMNKV